MYPKGAGKELEEVRKSCEKFHGMEKLREVEAKCLRLPGEFQDGVTRAHWKAPCFSGDGKWVSCASSSRGGHKLCIWGKAGDLVKILECPKEAIIDLGWHPFRLFVVSDFKELEENDEYVEKEEEFNLISEPEKMQVKYLDMDVDVDVEEEVDIMTAEGDLTFNLSDASREKLHHLPVSPFLDISEQRDNFMGGCSPMVENNHHIASALSMEESAEQSVCVYFFNPTSSFICMYVRNKKAICEEHGV